MKGTNEVDKIYEYKTWFFSYIWFRWLLLISILFLNISICVTIWINIKCEWYYLLLITLAVSSPLIYVKVRISIGIYKWFIAHKKIKKLLVKYKFTKKIKDINFCNLKEKELKKKLLKLYDIKDNPSFDFWTSVLGSLA
ncbi:MAG: hypothetical protein Ta2E_04520 [Mycoplasmoidaceae bacterium]|nr:MAG: hypothetical protein Ta2E_04520 [Mycoplasmoidaceae bacterium]